MDTIFIFFVLPIVTIIFSLVLQKILKCPVLVAATFLAVSLILAFTVLDTTFLIIGIILTILAFITASISQIICKIRDKIRRYCGCEIEDNNCCNNNSNNVCNNDCDCDNSDNNQNIMLNAEVMPNRNNNGTTGSFRGCYRRRF